MSDRRPRSGPRIRKARRRDLFAQVIEGAGSQSPHETKNGGDAFEGQTGSLADWLGHANTIVAFLLAPDGTIRARNHAAVTLLGDGPDGRLARRFSNLL